MVRQFARCKEADPGGRGYEPSRAGTAHSNRPEELHHGRAPQSTTAGRAEPARAAAPRPARAHRL